MFYPRYFLRDRLLRDSILLERGKPIIQLQSTVADLWILPPDCQETGIHRPAAPSVF